MKNKLLELLKTKFPGVQDSILDGVATKLSKTVTKEDQTETAISGVTFDTLLQSETDRRVTEVSETAVKNYEKKHKLKDGKTTEKAKDPEQTPKKKEGEEEEPEWAKKLNQRLDDQASKLEKQEKDREISGKRSDAAKLLKASKVPEKYQEKWINRIDLEDEENSVEDQIKGLEAEYLEIKQEIVNSEAEGESKGGETTDTDMDTFLDEEFPEAAKEET